MKSASWKAVTFPLAEAIGRVSKVVKNMITKAKTISAKRAGDEFATESMKSLMTPMNAKRPRSAGGCQPD
ncbi:hypothetical protein GCM10009569_07090 [Arthrobacter russicus]